MSSSEEPRASGSGSGSGDGSQLQSAPTNGRKRGRYANMEEMFVGSTPEEVERQTTQYRDLLTQAEETKTDLANRSFKDIRSAVLSGEALFKTTKDTGVASLDAKLMHTTVESAVTMARKNRVTGGSFNVDEFLIRIKGVLGLDRVEREDMSPSSEDELDDDGAGPSRRARNGRLGDWEKLGWMAAKHSRRVPGIEFMYGPLAVEHTKRVTQRRARRRSVGVEQRPQEITNQPKQPGKKAAVDDMVSNVVTVHQMIKERDQGDGISFLELVVNPDDYGQTVENIFYASFLIKEGHAGIQVDEDGQIIIRSEEINNEDDPMTIPKNQAVIELDMDAWRDAIDLYNIKKPLIPHRDYGLTNTARPEAGAWYG